MTSSVAFPQLGIGPFDLNRVAFSIGDFNVYWYAIIITFGMILAILFAMKFAKRYQLSSDDLLDVVLWCIPTALIGARIYYVLFSIQDFLTDGKLDWGKVFAVRNGGLAIYGGVIVGFVVAYLVCRYKKIDVMAVFDIGAMGFLNGQCIRDGVILSMPRRLERLQHCLGACRLTEALRFIRLFCMKVYGIYSDLF